MRKMATPTIGVAIIVLIFFLPHRSNVSFISCLVCIFNEPNHVCYQYDASNDKKFNQNSKKTKNRLHFEHF